MTWNVMTHEVERKAVELLTDDKGRVIGFSLAGYTYDGDGNVQDENGTRMNIVFQSRVHLTRVLRDIAGEIRKDFKEEKNGI